VITGASTDLGAKTIQDLLATGEYHVIAAYSNQDDVQKATADNDSSSGNNLTPLLCDLESFDSVREFCSKVHEFRGAKTLDRLICQTSTTTTTSSSGGPIFTQDGHEKTNQVNFLSPFLMTSKLLDGMLDSTEARVSVVMGKNTKDDGLANLGTLQGYKAGFKSPIAMVDGSTSFYANNACADAVLCQKLLTNFLHNKYNTLTGVVFNNLDLDADSSSNPNECLSELIIGPTGAQSGVSLVLAKDGTSSSLVEADISSSSSLSQKKAYDIDAAFQLCQLANEITNTEWPAIKQVTSPCPTLKVVGAITKNNVAKEELKRMKLGRPGISEPIPELVKKVSKRKRASALAQRVLGTVVSQTLGRVARLLGKRMLGEVPDTALEGSFDTTAGDTPLVTEADVEAIQAVISEQLAREKKKDFGDKSKSCIVSDSTVPTVMNVLVSSPSLSFPVPLDSISRTCCDDGNFIWSGTQGGSGTSSHRRLPRHWRRPRFGQDGSCRRSGWI
jgi:short chain dehydrogenase